MLQQLLVVVVVMQMQPPVALPPQQGCGLHSSSSRARAAGWKQQLQRP